jgi:hypothetical protein
MQMPFQMFQPPVEVDAGNVLRFEYKYNNPSAETHAFGPHVDTQQACVAIFYVYPWDSSPSLQTCVDVKDGGPSANSSDGGA